MPANRMLENDSVVLALQHAICSGAFGLSDVPVLLKRVLTQDCWQERMVKCTGERARFRRFMEFVRTASPEGLGSDLKTLHRLCAEDPVALDLLDQVTVGGPGAPKGNKNAAKGKTNPDNIRVSSTRLQAKQGTSRQYALRRLRRSRPDLHAKVLAGELSPHRAMIQAGFRREPMPLKELRKWWGKASEGERVEFVRDKVLVWMDGNCGLINGWQESWA